MIYNKELKKINKLYSKKDNNCKKLDENKVKLTKNVLLSLACGLAFVAFTPTVFELSYNGAINGLPALLTAIVEMGLAAGGFNSLFNIHDARKAIKECETEDEKLDEEIAIANEEYHISINNAIKSMFVEHPEIFERNHTDQREDLVNEFTNRSKREDVINSLKAEKAELENIDIICENPTIYKKTKIDE